MNDYVAAPLLGLVQGLTEFLPVSSSGHLILASSLLGAGSPHLAAFEVVIQLGSSLAVLVLYRQRFFDLLLPGAGHPFSGLRGLYLLFLTCLPASLLGLFAYPFIKAHLFTPVSVALALAVGALFILFAEGKSGRLDPESKVESLDKMNPRLALGIGIFQCLSLWPGFSRSTSTIMGGLLLGASRAVAAEYSFLAAVPIMCGAALVSLASEYRLLGMDDLPFFALGTFMAFVSAMTAIKVFVSLISRISFRPFAWYRLIISPLILWFWM
jgi:undecaprenyl-diphosphatase